jgi:hypothetical protein
VKSNATFSAKSSIRYRFTRQFDYFRWVLEACDVPADELLGASVRGAAEARPEPERGEFLVAAGRDLARLLSRDMQRLEEMLRRVRVGGGD